MICWIYKLEIQYSLKDKHSIEPRIIHKVCGDKFYTDAAFIDYLDRVDYNSTWFRTEKEAIRAQGLVAFLLNKRKLC